MCSLKNIKRYFNYFTKKQDISQQFKTSAKNCKFLWLNTRTKMDFFLHTFTNDSFIIVWMRKTEMLQIRGTRQ